MMSGVLEDICDFLNSTQGLDKLYRLLSYASKLISALLGTKAALSLSFARLSRNISHTRTVMRLVGLLHNVRTCKEFEFKFEDWKSFKGLTRILTNFTYLPCDHLALLGREKILNFHPETIDLFSRTSAQSWLFGLLVEIVDLWKNMRESMRRFNNNLQAGRLGLKGSLKVLGDESRYLIAKTVLIVGDFPLAINYSLRNPFMSPVMIGVCGTASSLAALYLRWCSFISEQREFINNK